VRAPACALLLVATVAVAGGAGGGAACGAAVPGEGGGGGAGAAGSNGGGASARAAGARRVGAITGDEFLPDPLPHPCEVPPHLYPQRRYEHGTEPLLQDSEDQSEHERLKAQNGGEAPDPTPGWVKHLRLKVRCRPLALAPRPSSRPPSRQVRRDGPRAGAGAAYAGAVRGGPGARARARAGTCTLARTDRIAQKGHLGAIAPPALDAAALQCRDDAAYVHERDIWERVCGKMVRGWVCLRRGGAGRLRVEEWGRQAETAHAYMHMCVTPTPTHPNTHPHTHTHTHTHPHMPDTHTSGSDARGLWAQCTSVCNTMQQTNRIARVSASAPTPTHPPTHPPTHTHTHTHTHIQVDLMDVGCGHNAPNVEDTRADMYSMMDAPAPGTDREETVRRP